MGKDLYADDDDDAAAPAPTKKAPSGPPSAPAAKPLWPSPNFAPLPKTAPAPPPVPPPAPPAAPPNHPPPTGSTWPSHDPYADADDDRAIPAPSGAPDPVKKVNGRLVLKEPCPRCGDKNAVILATSVSCPNRLCATNAGRKKTTP